MPTEDLSSRLTRLEYGARRQSQTGEPKRLLGFQRPSPAKELRLNELWNQLNGELTDVEADELYALLKHSMIFEEVEEENNRQTGKSGDEDESTYVRVF